MFVIQLCTSVPALDGLEMIQTTTRIIAAQVKIFVINRFHLLLLANISASRCHRLPEWQARLACGFLRGPGCQQNSAAGGST